MAEQPGESGVIVREAATPSDLAREIELRIALSESGLSLLTGGDIRNTSDPANDGATGISIRNVYDAEAGIFHPLVNGDHTFVLDALARKHAFDVGADRDESSFTHNFNDRSADNFAER